MDLINKSHYISICTDDSSRHNKEKCLIGYYFEQKFDQQFQIVSTYEIDTKIDYINQKVAFNNEAKTDAKAITSYLNKSVTDNDLNWDNIFFPGSDQHSIFNGINNVQLKINKFQNDCLEDIFVMDINQI